MILKHFFYLIVLFSLFFSCAEEDYNDGDMQTEVATGHDGEELENAPDPDEDD